MDILELFKNLNEDKTEKLYFFYGCEELLKRQAVNKIKDLLVPPSFENFNLTILEGGKAVVQDIINAVETLPFMNERRMVLVKDLNLSASGKDRLTGEDMGKLDEYFKNIPEYSCLVISTRKNADMRTRIMKTIKKEGVVVRFDKLKSEHFVKWVKKQIDKENKSIYTSSLKRFIDISGYLDRDSKKTLEDVANEINKLVEYCRNKKVIAEEDIEAVAPRNLRTNIFKLVDAIGLKDTPTSLRLLEDMKLAREPALKVLFMITRQFRLLLQAACLKDAGYSSKGIISRLKLQPFIVNSLIKQSQNFSIADLKKALMACSRWDSQIKTGKIEPWLAIELFIIESGKNSNKKSVL